jgi:hypothetical protein
MNWEDKNMGLYKVAKHIDSRPLSTHIYLHTALAARREAGFEYHVYLYNLGKSKWEKI